MELALKPKAPTRAARPLADVDVLRILMIDDDPGYRTLCERYLHKSRRAKFHVTMASSVAEGLEALKNAEFDCLLVDYVLPDFAGTQVIRSIRDSEIMDANPPTVIMSAQGGEDAAADAVRAGAMDFLPKRIVSSTSLVSAITNAVQKNSLRKSVVASSSKLQCAIEELKTKNEEISRFYQLVSHEVKTPLSAAREFIAITLDGIAGPVTDYQKEMLTHALDSCDQIGAHFNDLIEVTRLENQKIELNRELASIDEVVTRCFASMNKTIVEKKIFVKKRIINALPPFWFDVNRIIQVLSNLLGNAIKYTPEGGTVTLALRYSKEQRCIDIAVSDEGCGITEKDQARVFDRLYQVGNSDASMGSGLGLGLSIAKEIVELHNGQLSVESEIGKGSTFNVQLPSGIRDSE
ncbi:MAG: sensor histidine kinase [Gammaproteobacteria bacterium]